MKKIKTFVITLSLVMVGSFMQAQRNAALSDQQKGFILNTWYEVPQESKGDTLTFSLTKHINVPPADVVGFEHNKLVFINATDFKVEYWTKCPNNINAATGKWSYTSGSSIKLIFDTGKCNDQLTVLEVTATKLKVVVK